MHLLSQGRPLSMLLRKKKGNCRPISKPHDFRVCLLFSLRETAQTIFSFLFFQMTDNDQAQSWFYTKPISLAEANFQRKINLKIMLQISVYSSDFHEYKWSCSGMAGRNRRVEQCLQSNLCIWRSHMKTWALHQKCNQGK